ncbi:MAG: glycosyltransferase family 1 protein [Cyanobacteria bacterium J06643_4]
MDVHADGLIHGLKSVRPAWKITEHCPQRPNLSGWLKPLESLSKYTERYWHYPNRLKQIDADILHIIDHSDGYLCDRLRRNQQLNVVTCHDLINLIQPETFRGRAIFPWLSMTLWQQAVQSMKQANHVITVSAHTKQDTVEHLGISPKDITVIHNAVNNGFRPLNPEHNRAVRERYSLANGTFCLLNVGSNNARKNISAILSVIDRLKSQELPVVFWKAGADFDLSQKQFIQTRGLGSVVRYLGKPTEETLVELYNAADCLIAPSLYEGFGFTILEAMACGTPVITANVSAMPEVAGDAALLVDPNDIEVIARAVQDLHTHPEKAKALVRKGLTRVQNFSWENTAEQAAQVYEQVLAQSTNHMSKS